MLSEAEIIERRNKRCIVNNHLENIY